MAVLLAHSASHFYPHPSCPRDGSCALRSFSSVNVAFLLASARFFHCQSLKTFSLMPAIFQTPEVTDHQAHSDRHFGRHEACGDRNWLIFSISRFVLLTDSVISKTTSGPTGEQAWQWICTKWVRRRMFGWIQENPLLSEKQKVQSVPSFLSKRKHLKQEIHKSGNNKQQPTLWVFSL